MQMGTLSEKMEQWIIYNTKGRLTMKTEKIDLKTWQKLSYIERLKILQAEYLGAYKGRQRALKQAKTPYIIGSEAEKVYLSGKR